ncbi:hypothetical protein [Caenimonas aquaedulcis]|uniref:Uncharacterized protein n=1 Tax=Caenimonas aquaedulcis TaxID=2793270 RepID=A0A931H3W0_9BURK|nr:hypothetical protein [Caenimonas aquaedulcis]MBG9388131.1 hypothetical protein [Caenimonas aquaedulcis]
MTGAADRLARSRLAILQQLERREKRRDGDDTTRARAAGDDTAGEQARAPGEGWFSRRFGGRFGGRFDGLNRAAQTWWRHHPAHMALEVATPVLSSYARKHPAQFLGIAAAVGAVVVVARPWRLMSATGLVVALLKSSQLSNIVMSAMSGADFGKDEPPYE